MNSEVVLGFIEIQMQKTVRKYNPSRETQRLHQIPGKSCRSSLTCPLYPIPSSHLPSEKSSSIVPSSLSFCQLSICKTSLSFFPQPSIPNPVTNGRPFPFQTSFCIHVLDVSSRAYQLLTPHFLFFSLYKFSLYLFSHSFCYFFLFTFIFLHFSLHLQDELYL